MPPIYSYGLLLIFSATTACAQFAEDTTFVNSSIENAVKVYQQQLKSQSKLYNGSKYPLNYESIEGEHPFFSSEDWIMGDVLYDGELFTQVPLMYDIVSSNLITEHFPTGHAIQLVWGKLRHFSIAGHRFEKIENESVGSSLPRTDFYDILYRGPTKVIAQHVKIKRVRIEGLEVQTSFPAKTRYYIFKNGVFFHVQSKASVLKVLKNEKQALKKFLKTNRIFFGFDRESSLKRMAVYYDTLKESKP